MTTQATADALTKSLWLSADAVWGERPDVWTHPGSRGRMTEPFAEPEQPTVEFRGRDEIDMEDLADTLHDHLSDLIGGLQGRLGHGQLAEVTVSVRVAEKEDFWPEERA